MHLEGAARRTVHEREQQFGLKRILLPQSLQNLEAFRPQPARTLPRISAAARRLGLRAVASIGGLARTANGVLQHNPPRLGVHIAE